MGSGKVAKPITGRDGVTRTYWVNPEPASKSSVALKATPAPALSSTNPYSGSTEYVHLEDTSGELVTVVPGELSGSVRHIYRNGQCMAMAVALSRETGWPIVTREFELELGGEKKRLLHHAYVLSPDGHLVDIDGYLDWEGDRVKSWRGEDIVTVTEADHADTLLDSYAHRLSEQDTDLAETYLDHVLTQYEEDLARS